MASGNLTPPVVVLISPATVRVEVGFVVPMPTLPLPFKYKVLDGVLVAMPMADPPPGGF